MTTLQALEKLRDDAWANGLRDLALLYQQSVVRLYEEQVLILLRKMRE